MICLKGHSGDVHASTAHKGLLVTGGHDKSLSIWDGQGNLKKRLKNTHEHIVRALAIYTGPLYRKPVVISGSWDGTIKLWSLDEGKKPISTLCGHESRVKALSPISEHSKDSPALLVSGGDDYFVKIWDLDTKECIRTIEDHKHFIMDLAICHNSIEEESEGRNRENIIISSSSDKTTLAHLLQGSASSCQLVGHGKSDVTSLLFVAGNHSYGSVLCSGNAEGEILVYSVKSILEALSNDPVVQVMPQFSLLGHQAKVTGLCLSNSSSDPLLFSVSSDGYFRSWQLTNREAGAICSNMNEMMGSVNGGKKSGTKIGLLSCASTPTYRVSSSSHSVEEVQGEIYHGVRLKASEEVILTGTDGFVLLLSIATLESNGTSSDVAGVTNGESVESGEISSADACHEEGAPKDTLQASKSMPPVDSGSGDEIIPIHEDPPTTSSSASVPDFSVHTSHDEVISKEVPSSSKSSSSLLAMIADPNLSFGAEDVKEEAGSRDPPSPAHAQDGSTVHSAAPSGGLKGSFAVPFNDTAVTAQGNGRRAAKALSSTNQARERAAQRKASSGRGAGGRGRRQILQPSADEDVPMNILLASGPRA